MGCLFTATSQVDGEVVAISKWCGERPGYSSIGVGCQRLVEVGVFELGVEFDCFTGFELRTGDYDDAIHGADFDSGLLDCSACGRCAYGDDGESADGYCRCALVAEID